MKVMLFGAGGQLSTDIAKYGKIDFKYGHSSVDIIDKKAPKLIIKHKPDIVINCAAYHNLIQCENNMFAAFIINGYAAGQLAVACDKVNATLIHISTDYVFGDKERQYSLSTDHPVNPLNIYGMSKFQGEMLIRRYCKKHFILRTSALYGDHSPKAKRYGNFVKMMLTFADEVSEGKREKIEVVYDQYTVPTYTKYLAKQIHQIKRSKEYGTYHVVCKNHMGVSWFQFAREIMKAAKTKVPIYPRETVDDGIPRPMFSALRLSLPPDVKCVMPYWKDALMEYIKR